MKILNNWTLYYAKENTVLTNLSKCKKINNVTIPTFFELEIAKVKLLGDPYYSTNNWKYQQYEAYHQYYVNRFSSNKKTAYIRLERLDTLAEIYINNKLIGKTDNYYTPFIFKLENLKKNNNKLIIHILPCCVEGLKHDFSHISHCCKYNLAGLYIRKPASSFGWDILPRTPLGGIGGNIEILPKLSLINNAYFAPIEVTKEKAVLRFEVDKVENVTFKVCGKCNDSTFEVNTNECTEITIKDPKLWTIRGYGKQYLYDIKIVAISNNNVLETKRIKYGIRKVSLDRTSTVCENGKFEFKINDQKVFLLGSNWVPTEAIKHVDNKRAKRAIDMLIDLNCNAIRIWGGGTYETEYLYSLCDKLGIFIWQDFMMGCATYPQDEEFKTQIKKETECVVKALRNHPSICVWAGDNENDLAFAFWGKEKANPNISNILTRKTIPEVLNQLDPYRPYIPSSPYVDEYAFNHKNLQLSEDHLWGPRDYFKGEYYKNVNPYFTSETGYHGLNSVKSLNKFMKKPWPLFDKQGRPQKEYMCHGTSITEDYNSPYAYRTKLMADQVKTLFVDKIDNLKDFVLASQISQAEAMKYFIEKMRRDTSRNGGIIWWNILDGWPQVSDAVVDYYFDKKLAYYYIKKSQQDVLIFIDEDEKEEKIYASSLLDERKHINYQIIDAFVDKIFLKGEIDLKERESKMFNTFINDGKKHFYVIKYRVDDKECINSFFTNIRDIEFIKYVNILKKYKCFK